jgi:hypothetical protein
VHKRHGLCYVAGDSMVFMLDVDGTEDPKNRILGVACEQQAADRIKSGSDRTSREETTARPASKV